MITSSVRRFALVAGAGIALSSWPSPAAAQDEPKAWGVQLSGSFSEAEARATYDRVRRMLPEIVPMGPPVVVDGPYGSRGPGRFYRARVGTASRPDADALCGMIRAGGSSCVVLRMEQRP